jgi:alpha-tubulin suppressor-like RCC1 family protein
MTVRAIAIVVAAAAVAGCTGDPARPPAVLPDRVMTIVSGDGQRAPAGLMLPRPPTVALTATNGTPLPGVEVLWQVIEGGGVVDAFRTFTDSTGRAAVRWTLGDDIGNQLLYASSAGTGGVTFRATSALFFSSGAAGWRHGCALDPRGRAWCWGSNQWGQLGDATRAGGPAHRPVAGRLNFAAIFPGMLHSCALAPDGAAYCWGDNGGGQLGDGSTRPATAPVAVLGGLRFRALAVGYLHTCGVTVQAELYCWGSNGAAQLGVPVDEWCTATESNCRRTPARVALPGPVMEVAAGEDHTCAVTGTEHIFCWGANGWGQLGTGTFGGRAAAPAAVATLRRFQSVAASARGTCALDAGGRAFCWGQNAAGRLGTNTTLNEAAPAQVVDGDAFVDIGMGPLHSCGRTAAGTVRCWGALRGDGAAGSTLRPVDVHGGPYTALSVGGTHACAYREGVWCWGSNEFGQLGLPSDSIPTALAPVLVRAGPPGAATASSRP